jgi:hypothetical protein
MQISKQRVGAIVGIDLWPFSQAVEDMQKCRPLW